jgi:hypothetical protein
MRLFTLNHVDLVITNQLLAGRSGRHIASEMKRLKPEVPIILYAGLQELPPGAGNANVILVRGTTPPEFLAAVAKLIAKHKSTGAGKS